MFVFVITFVIAFVCVIMAGSGRDRHLIRFDHVVFEGMVRIVIVILAFIQ